MFRGHPNLIVGFNTFLPPGYRIEATENPMDPVIITTPSNETLYLPVNPLPMNSDGIDSGGGGGGIHQIGTTSHSNPSISTLSSSSASQSKSRPSIPTSSATAPSYSLNERMTGVFSHLPPPPSSLGSNHHEIHSGSLNPSQGSRNGSPSLGSFPSSKEARRAPVEFNHAINYVNKIKVFKNRGAEK